MSDMRDEFVQSGEAHQICGGISKMTEHRWSKTLPDFPKPAVINRKKYYLRSELLAFMERRRSVSAKVKKETAEATGDEAAA